MISEQDKAILVKNFHPIICVNQILGFMYYFEKMQGDPIEKAEMLQELQQSLALMIRIANWMSKKTIYKT